MTCSLSPGGRRRSTTTPSVSGGRTGACGTFGEMKIVPRIRTLDDHDEKVAPVIKITVAHRRLELFPVLFDPVLQVNRRLHRSRAAARCRWRWNISNIHGEASLFPSTRSVKPIAFALRTGNGQHDA